VAYDRPELLSAARIETGTGLVQEENFGIVHKCQSEGYPLSFTTGQPRIQPTPHFLEA